MFVNKFVMISSFFISNLVLINFIAKTFEFYKWICVLIISPILSWFISNIIYKRICTEKVSPNNKAILITGCDTGFGYELAKECDKLGFYVFAGVLRVDQNGAKDLQNLCSQKLKVLKMDVTKHEDVVNAINEIKCSDLNLWAVVNNAGISINSPIEWGYDVNQLSDIFSVNIMGAVRVAKLSLPLLRQSKGRIINISSLAGRMTFPGITFYCMSKHAIRSFSNGLRKEVETFGIKVINIEPVLYKTPISDWSVLKKSFDKVWEQTPEDVQNVYTEKFRNNYEKKTKSFLNTTRKQTKEVIGILVKALTLREAQNNYKCGGILDFIITFPLSYFPENIQEFVIKYFLRNPILVQIYKMFSNKS